MRQNLLLLLVVALLPAGLAACGSDDGDRPVGASPTEQAFLKGMIPHHESAVDMAEIARERARQRAVEELAREIVETQGSEIAQMERIYERLTGEEVFPDPAAHAELGLSRQQAGMHEGDIVTLEQTHTDFDKAFIDAMVPHHQGAIRQARTVLLESEDRELRQLANTIISDQSREIEQMNRWRERWYGAPSPAGGVPSDSEPLPPSGSGAEHESGH